MNRSDDPPGDPPPDHDPWGDDDLPPGPLRGTRHVLIGGLLVLASPLSGLSYYGHRLPVLLAFVVLIAGFHPRPPQWGYLMRLADQADVHERLLTEAVAAYDPDRVPANFRHVPAQLLATVQRLNGGSWRRCEICDDGSIVIHNRPVW